MRLKSPPSFFTGIGLLSLAGDCATTKHQESRLTAAGFRIVTATTPQQAQQLKAVPPGKFSAIKRNGKSWHVHPEAANHRIYLGTKNEYQQYLQNGRDADNSRQSFDSRIIAQEESADGNDRGDWEIIFIGPN